MAGRIAVANGLAARRLVAGAAACGLLGAALLSGVFYFVCIEVIQ
jgi:hypothetical protein